MTDPASKIVSDTDAQPLPPAPSPVLPPQVCGAAFGLPRTYLNNRFVYAVISQRARGLSIGVNLNPDRRCNWDCIYCEVNRAGGSRDRRVNVKVMSSELRHLLALADGNQMGGLPWFRNLPAELLQLKEVALSGDGEPTLCPNFREVLGAVLRIRANGKHPPFKIVLLTNTSGLRFPEVRRSLHMLKSDDEIWIKLDAGTQEYMQQVNRADLTLGNVMGNVLLIALRRPVIIQSLFPLINGQEPPAEEIEQYVQRLGELKAAGAQIALVQIYSAHRPPHGQDCAHLPLKSLSRIARRVREVTGLRTEVF